ncbi:hypothetical protein BIV60_17075 [Bacillus sp. MUM 116]|uniref:DUF2569 family protein n=1 Tax=Bacillus sp. MUM 116 TaxID=1678002 RepID=UPI0008F5DED4|nr:DUF2569 family protein [Bacillus sp. MUM 116]OIK11967.1 hypothetical protein BIV60_17075 [Bacillus sp. MUM 116]
MIKLFTGVYSVSVFLIWALGIGIHLWTIYIAYHVSGLFWAIISFFFPVLSQIYWGYKAWKIDGFDSAYIQWLIILTVLWVSRFVFALIIATSSDEPKKLEENGKPINGRPINGWLILIGIKIVASVSYGLVLLFRYVEAVSNFDPQWIKSNLYIDAVNITYVQTFLPLTAVIILFIMNSFLAYLFFTKNKEFPKAFIYLNITAVVITMFLEFITILSGELIYFSDTITDFIWLIIWGIYLMRSQRVKETFVNTKRKKYVKITEEEYVLIKQNLSQ